MVVDMVSFLRRPDLAPAVLLAASAGMLAFAFAAQFGFGLAPCELCVWQRYPHALVAGLGLVAIPLARDGKAAWFPLALAAAVLLAGAGVAGFHVGVEQGWWQGLSGCTGAGGGAQSLADLKAQVMAAPVVRCDEVAWSFLGISMAGWNLLLSVGLAGYAAGAALRLANRRTA